LGRINKEILKSDRLKIFITYSTIIFLTISVVLTTERIEENMLLNKAGQKVYDFIINHPATIANNFSVSFVNVSNEIDGLHTVNLKIAGQDVAIYMTEDNDYIILSGIAKYDEIMEEFKVINEPVEYLSSCKMELSNDFDAVFVYSETCPHCKDMVPFVEGETSLNWYWINLMDDDCKDIDLNQFNFSGGVPHFYCTKNGEFQTGAFHTIEEFNIWVSECKN